MTVGVSAGRDIAVTVHNEGTPISAASLPVLFEPFRRTVVRSERSKGLGLGLFISQQIIAAHGGHVEVVSSAERGTTFTVSACEGPMILNRPAAWPNYS